MRTRFAPSPTGPLHLGHAYSAILAHDMARAAGGAFLLRMEDTDLERCRPEWETGIVEDLTWLGLSWDEPVHRQSDQIARYNARLEPLADRGLLYPCSCTRSDVRAALSAPQEGVAHSVYPGTCRHRTMGSRQPATRSASIWPEPSMHSPERRWPSQKPVPPIRERTLSIPRPP